MKKHSLLVWVCVLLLAPELVFAEQANAKKKKPLKQPQQSIKKKEAAKPTEPTQDEGFDIDSLMKQSTEAGQDSDVIFKGKNGAWVLARGKEDNTCSVIYFDIAHDSSIVYRGPRPDVGDKGSLVFIGPNVPPATAPVEVKIKLETDGEPAQTVPAGHIPAQGQAPSAILISTDIKATAAVMQPTEKVNISLDGKNIYKLEWDGGGHQAKDALLNCLNGK